MGLQKKYNMGSDCCTCSVQDQGPGRCCSLWHKAKLSAPPVSQLPRHSQQLNTLLLAFPPPNTHSTTSLVIMLHNDSSAVSSFKSLCLALNTPLLVPPKQLPPSYCLTPRASNAGVSPSYFILQISSYFPHLLPNIHSSKMEFVSE